MVIVSNTSPLLALDHLQELSLFPRVLAGEMLVPPAVAREFVRPLPDWLQVRNLNQPVATQIQGESEALALALESKADLILLDDRAARRLATALGIPLLGTLGLLLLGKGAGLIPNVRSRIEALRSLPFHISPRLYEAVLKTAGE